MFRLAIVGDDENFATNDQGEPLEYPDGATASAMQKALNEKLKERGEATRYRVCRVSNDNAPDWRAREQTRFDDGTYLAPIWASADWYTRAMADRPDLRDHYCHISRDDVASIAYTRDASKGEADIQTRIRPGRYLKRFYGHTLDAPQIAELAARHDDTYGVQRDLIITQDQTQIVWAYKNGPSSCMSYDESDYACDPHHPCEVYGGGDLGLAYIVDPDDDTRVTARALVWPEKKIAGRMYGDSLRLSRLLQEEGYETTEDGVDGEPIFEGARILAITLDGGYVMPYIDWHAGGYDDGKGYVIISHRHSDIDLQRTNGMAGNEDLETCGSCGDRFNSERETMAWIHDLEELYCEHCTDNHAWHCDISGNQYSDNVYPLTYETSHGLNQAHENHISDVAFYCHHCETFYSHQDFTSLTDSDGDTICEDCAKGYKRAPCGCVMLDDDKTMSDHVENCDDCDYYYIAINHKIPYPAYLRYYRAPSSRVNLGNLYLRSINTWNSTDESVRQNTRYYMQNLAYAMATGYVFPLTNENTIHNIVQDRPAIRRQRQGAANEATYRYWTIEVKRGLYESLHRVNCGARR